MNSAVIEALLKNEPRLDGRRDVEETFVELASKGIEIPGWHKTLLSDYSLIGTTWCIEEADDASGLGAYVEWYSAAQVLEEVSGAEPGLSVARLGFVPFGGDATGGGDPYFFDVRTNSQDPPVVRIPHDYAVYHPYPLERIELVTNSLSEFLRRARLL